MARAHEFCASGRQVLGPKPTDKPTCHFLSYLVDTRRAASGGLQHTSSARAVLAACRTFPRDRLPRARVDSERADPVMSAYLPSMVGVVALADPRVERRESRVDSLESQLALLERAGFGAALLVDEYRFPFGRRPSPIELAHTAVDIAAVAAKFSLDIGLDFVGEPEQAMAVAGATGCAFVRTTFAGPYLTPCPLHAPNLGTLCQIIDEQPSKLEVWLTLRPWGSKLADPWTVPDLVDLALEIPGITRACIRQEDAESVAVDRNTRIAFDGGVTAESVLQGRASRYIVGSVLWEDEAHPHITAPSLQRFANALNGGDS